MAMWTTADLLWFAYGTADGFHSVLSTADAMYILGLIPASLGLIFYPAGTWEPGARTRLLIDIVVLGGALLLVSEMMVLGEVVSRVGVGWDAFVYVVYPITDVLLAGLAVLLLLRSSGKPRLDLRAHRRSPSPPGPLPTTGTPCSRPAARTTSARLVDVAYVVAPAAAGDSPPWPRRVHGVTSRTLQRHVSGHCPPRCCPTLTALAALALCVVLGLSGTADWAARPSVLGPHRPSVSSPSRLRQPRACRHALEPSGRGPHRRTCEHLSERHQRILDSVGEGIFGVDRQLGASPSSTRQPPSCWAGSRTTSSGRDACAHALCTEEHDQCLVSMVMALGEAVTQSAREYQRHGGSELPVEVTAVAEGGPDRRSTAPSWSSATSPSARCSSVMKQRVRQRSVSHELRTPLTAIRGSLEMLADGDTGELPTAARASSSTWPQRGSERLTRLVNDIIDIERLEAGSFEHHA